MAEAFRPASIAFVPAGSMDVASSRLRCFGLAQELGKMGYAVQLGLTPGQAVDVLYIQKTVSADILAMARQVKERGGLVIYDIDDYGDALAWLKVEPEVHSSFIDLCDVICVDTDVRNEVFSKDPVYARIPHRWVIPDPIDYVGLPAGELTEEGPEKPAQGMVGCWFGNAPNIAPAASYLEMASRCPSVARIDIISNAQFQDKLKEIFPAYHIEAWKLSTFPQRLRQSDFCLLIHDSNVEGVQKSNNKMLAALALGVVPFVSRTPAYEETAKAMGLEDLLLDDSGTLPEKLSAATVQSLKDKIQGPLCQNELAHFMPAQVARQFSDQLQAMLALGASQAAKRLTIITHYYNNEEGIRHQLAVWKSYPPQVLAQLDILVVDDYSNPPSQPDFSGLPARFFRVNTDIDWNQCGCRNLAASQAKTDWLLFYDVDHTMDSDGILRLLHGLHTLDSGNIYQFARRENGDPIYSAPNCFLIDRRRFLDLGGYDEDFCGHYGFEDLHFLERWRRQGRGRILLTNVELLVDGVGTAQLDRDTSRNRQLMEEKLANDSLTSAPPVRFQWTEITGRLGTADAVTEIAA